MEQNIELIPEHREQEIILEEEPFLLAQSQSKTVPLSMANGDQIIMPDAGYLLSQVIVQKPETMKGENIRENINIGGEDGTYAGIVLDPLDNPADPQSVLLGKEYYDDQGVGHTGTFVVPTPPPLTNPAGPGQILAGYDARNDNDERVVGTFALTPLSNPAGPGQIIQGYDSLNDNNERVEGTFDPDNWTADFLVLHHTVVTVGTNNVNTTLGVKDYLLAQSGVDGNRLFAFSLREKPSYQIGEIGRCVLYPNSTIGYFSASQWTASGWGTGRMLSGYSAVLPIGSVYDIYYWSV